MLTGATNSSLHQRSSTAFLETWSSILLTDLNANVSFPAKVEFCLTIMSQYGLLLEQITQSINYTAIFPSTNKNTPNYIHIISNLLQHSQNEWWCKKQQCNTPGPPEIKPGCFWPVSLKKTVLFLGDWFLVTIIKYLSYSEVAHPALQGQEAHLN